MNKSQENKELLESASKAADMLKMLANTNRLMILCNLVDSSLSVNEISQKIGLSQSATSQHLAKMKELGVVDSTKKGLSTFYFISSVEVRSILSILYLIYCRN